jgi:ferric-dicitrate binding protein FerR (iron transport regulator)
LAVLGVVLVLQPSVFLPPEGGTQVADARLQGPRMDVLAGPVSLDGRPVGRPVQVPLSKTIQAERDGAAVLEYADETRVEFRSATRLAACPEGVRLEAGTVHVAVQKRAVKPEEPVFRVLTDNARVSVWGTKFSVQTENGGTTVQVTEGVVGVEPMAEGRVVGAESRVPAGQMARVDGKVVKLSPIVVPTAATGPSSVAEDPPLLRKP